MNRRDFIKASTLAAACLSTAPSLIAAAKKTWEDDLTFKISLAEWSLHRALQSNKITNLDFPRIAKREFGIDAIEFVDQFFADKAKDQAYLTDLKKRADDEGVYCHLIMLDTNGPLGAADKTARAKAVEKTKEWIDAAKFLGCKMVRVNAYGDEGANPSPAELRDRVAESCSAVADYAAQAGLQLVIENHGGLSSDAAWLASVMQAVNKPNFGTLPDFGNFDPNQHRYDSVEALMPYAKAVSAKSQKFTEYGMITDTDFFRMMRIVRDAGYNGWVGIESAPDKAEDEYEAIRRTKAVLNWVREEQAKIKPVFNGKDLDGWTKIEDGDWTIENGVLIGRNGRDWTTNPEKTGSWLSTKKQYENFRLEFQFTVNKGGNSGVFFRSKHTKNPAFTGYEMQIHDSPGRPASKGGPGSLYDVIAPEKNMIRPAGVWNSATITARGNKVRVEMNGEKIIDTELKLKRSAKGYIGLQNHDDKSEVRFKNIRIEEL
ncbi:MAG TPA: family 16 glycoside hydrolase [Verrucomicrobiae bacterium]